MTAETRSFLEPAFPEKSIPVVFAANNHFVPIFAACFQSLLDHVSPENNYDVLLLQTNVSQENKDILSAMAENHPNVSLRFFDVSGLISRYDLKANAHISVETYFRFLIQSVLPDYEKVLYLDCDLIVNWDVAELYAIDVDGYLLAAARDPEVAGHVNGAGKDLQRYVRDELKLSNPFDYLQAGVLLFNEAEMRKAYTQEQWLSFASVPHRFNDQDVLNIYCDGRVKFLDMSWNLITDCCHTRVAKYINYAPQDIQDAYHAAHANPKLIHYAGHRKPWQDPNEDLADYFWDAARKTPYYDEVYAAMSERMEKERKIEEERSRSLYWKLRRLAKKLLRK